MSALWAGGTGTGAVYALRAGALFVQEQDEVGDSTGYAFGTLQRATLYDALQAADAARMIAEQRRYRGMPAVDLVAVPCLVVPLPDALAMRAAVAEARADYDRNSPAFTATSALGQARALSAIGLRKGELADWLIDRMESPP